MMEQGSSNGTATQIRTKVMTNCGFSVFFSFSITGRVLSDDNDNF